MGRDISPTLAGILASQYRDIDWTLDLTVGTDVYYLATSPLEDVNGHDYLNYLEKVGQVRQTNESPTDQVTVAIQNKDRVLGLTVAGNLDGWRTAEAVLGRLYYEVDDAGERTGVTEWIEMFRGAVQQPIPDDLQVSFAIIADTVAPGEIVASRNLGAICPFVVNDPKTCTLVGATCDHHLKSAGGCDGNNNSHHFGGTEHRYAPNASIPGTGGNVDPVGGGGPTCPRLDQLIIVRDYDGHRRAIPVYKLAEDDWLWDPIEEQFYPLRTARVVRDVPIWELATQNDAATFSSFTHRVMPEEDHGTGLPVELLALGAEVLTEIDGDLVHSHAVITQDTRERGDVMFIEMAGGHHYATGEMANRLIVAHNNKPNPLDGPGMIGGNEA